MVTRSLALSLAAGVLLPVCAHAQNNNLPAPVEQEQLSELNVWTVGALSRADGAMPRTMWTQTDPALLAAALDRLPAVYDAPAMQALARRVLLSPADAPAGDASAAARERFEALGKMGAADELAIMAAGAGASATDVAIAQYAAQAELARGRRNEACARGRNAQVGDQAPAFLLRLRAYCAAAGGDRAAADLALELARAQNAADAWYTAAVAATGGAPAARPPAARYDNSLSTQLSLAAQLRPGANALANASTLALVALARAETAPQPQRAQAAALAFRRGALSVAETRAIFAAIPAEVTTGLPAIAVAARGVLSLPTGAGPEAVSVVANENARLITGVLRSATRYADFAAAARLFHGELQQIGASTPAEAALFARAALAAGDVDLAQRYIAAAQQPGGSEAVVAPLEAALFALSGAAADPAAMVLERRMDRAPRAQLRAAARDVTILSALGVPVSVTVQTFLLANPPQGGAAADAAVMLALNDAVTRGSIGEGALLAVAAAGEGGPARLNFESVVAIVQALRALGLDDDAQRVAAETILAGAPPAS